MKRRIFIAGIFLTLSCTVFLFGCEGKKQKETKTVTKKAAQDVSGHEDIQQTLTFVDVFGQTYDTVIVPDVPKHNYDWKYLSDDGNYKVYSGDSRYSCRLGVDVSEHQGVIDWPKVKAAGYDFAFIRLGYRGYGQEGRICQDQQFSNNMQNAKAAGLDVGVYFFAQAINEAEALEEADFVLQNLAGISLQCPVVYDPESILDDEARTDNVSGDQFTRNTEVFLDEIAKAGYQPMVYSNMLWEAFELDLSALKDYPIWYADYEKVPQTPYHFEYWQYTNVGYVDGIEGATDLNIQFIKE